jgi:hypothetical protein
MFFYTIFKRKICLLQAENFAPAETNTALGWVIKQIQVGLILFMFIVAFSLLKGKGK